MDETVKYEAMGLLSEMRGLLDRAKAAGRELTGDERQRYDLLEAEHDRLTDGTRTLNDEPNWLFNESYLDQAEQSVDPVTRAKALAAGKGNQDRTGDSFKFWRNPETKGARHAFNRYLVFGSEGISSEEYRALSVSTRGLQMDSDVLGGYLVMPMALQNQVITKLKDLTWMRQLAKIYTCAFAQSLGIATVEADPGDHTLAFTGELLTGQEDTTMRMGQRVLRPHDFSRRILVSNNLIRQSSLNPESVVIDRLSYVASIVEEYAFLCGDGTNKPLGVFVESDFGIPASRDLTSGGVATIKPDDIFEVIYNCKAQYRRNGGFVMGRTATKAVRKLKDGEGRWIWEPSLMKGEPARLAGYPVFESEYCPSFVSGGYAICFGDFSNYVICDALDMQIQRLSELYAASNQVGFILRKSVDGQPCSPGGEAFTRLKLQ